MKNKLTINLETALNLSTIARQNGVISEAAQKRLLRRINGPSEWDNLLAVIAKEERTKIKQITAEARIRIAAIQAQIHAEIAPQLIQMKKAEQECFLIEFRTSEDLEAERTYSVSKKIAAENKPAIAFGPEWWEAEEVKERTAKKEIRHKLKRGESVPEIELLKYGFIDIEDDEKELVEA